MAILKPKAALVAGDFVNGALFSIDMDLVDGIGAPNAHWIYNSADEQLDLYIDPFASLPSSRTIRQDFVFDPISGSVQWQDARADYRVVADIAERAQLTDPAELADGTLCYVVANQTTYIYRGGVWAEYMIPPPRTDILQRLQFDPEEPANEKLIWRDARTDVEVVQDIVDLNNRALLPLSHLTAGKLVYVRSSGQIYELGVDPATMTNTTSDWTPLVGGVTYVGRVGNLPSPANTTLIDGQLFIIRMDFLGEDLYRLVSWDSSIPAPNITYADISQLAFNVTPTQASFPILPPDQTEIEFVFPPGAVLGQNAVIALRVTYREGNTGQQQIPSFQVNATPGMTASQIASMFEAEFLNVLPGSEISAVQTGNKIALSPRAAVQPIAPTRDVGPFATAGDFSATPSPGDWAQLTGSFTVPSGNLAGTVVANGGTLFYVDATHEWIYQPPTVTGGTTVQINLASNPNYYGAHLTFSGVGNMNYFTAGGNGIGDGQYAIMTGGTFTFPAPDPQYPLMGNLAGQTVRNGDFIVQTAANTYQVLPNTGPENTDIRNAYTAGQTTYALGGAVTSAPAPPASYQPPGTTNLHVQIDAITTAKVAQGPMTTPLAGGWRFLNRKIWNKDARIDPDQTTDQRDGDIQITREDQHEQIKSWNPQSNQWDMIYSRDEINSAIAALSLFEGTVQEVGGQAPGAVELSNLPDLAAMTTAGDASKVSHYWTWVGAPGYAVTAQTPVIGADLAGAILNPGDWVQVSRHNQIGNAALGTPGGGTLAWSWIGGDLLAKARADRLFGLQPWSAAGWEQGSLVLFDGDVYRARVGVTSQDPPPKIVQAAIDIALSGFVSNDLTGNPLSSLPATPNDGDVETTTGAGTLASLGEPFYGKVYAAGDSFVYSADPAFAGTGTTPDGYEYDSGWIYVGQTNPVPNPLSVNPPQPPTPWELLNIGGGLKVAQTDADLPTHAPPGQTWIVLQSGQAGGKQALFAFDQGTQQWQQLGGGGIPLDLSGGTIIYPDIFYVDDDLHGTLADAIASGQLTVQPSIAGDILASKNSADYPLIKAISQNGTDWKDFHPNRATFDTDGASRSAKADYPTQFNIAYNAGRARITHVGARDHSWVPLGSQRMVFVWTSNVDETDLTGGQTQTGALHVGVPRDTDGGIIDTGWSEACVDVWFPSPVDPSGANDQYCEVEVYVSNSATPGQGTIVDRQVRTQAVLAHWQHHHSWNFVIQQRHSESSFFVHAVVTLRLVQEQSTPAVQARMRLSAKAKRYTI